MEIKRKWNGKYFTKRNNVQWNGNGKEMEWKKMRKTKWKISKLEWNGKGVEMEWKVKGRWNKDRRRKYVIEMIRNQRERT